MAFARHRCGDGTGDGQHRRLCHSGRAYLQALGLAKDDLVQALGLSFTVSTIALAASLGVRGAFDNGNLALSVLAILPALAGMWAGQVLRSRIAPATFRRWFLICLLLLGAEMCLGPH
jgi:uncharacterized membrane protein YfcA